MRDVLVDADIGLTAAPDFKQNAEAVSMSTSVSIRDDLSYRSARPGNGVLATRMISSDLRTKNNRDEYGQQTLRGIMALLKALPEADAYWVSSDGEFHMLIRRKGRLVLSRDQTTENRRRDAARRPSLIAMVDLPYTMEPHGRHWDFIDNHLFKQAARS